MKEIILQYNNEDGTWGIKPEPYAVIEVATEEDFNRLEAMIKKEQEKDNVSRIDREKATELIMSLPKKDTKSLFDDFRNVLNSLDISQTEYQCLAAIIAEIKERNKE